MSGGANSAPRLADSVKKTNAVRLLDRARVAYELHEYDIAIEDFSAEAVADLLGLPRERVFKTLVVRGKDTGPCFAVVPAGHDLDLKALAVARSDRKVEMMPLREVEPLTGYVRGGVTVLGARKKLPVVIDESALERDVIAVSAGLKGLQVALAPRDYIEVTGAATAPISS